MPSWGIVFVYMNLVIATRNSNKIKELKRILEGLDVTLFTLDDFPGCPEPEETEDTFEGNAAIKARAVAEYTGRAALADDSGLEAYDLGGEPGVRSARYAGEEATDRDNVKKLLSELANTPDYKREARFVCVIVLARPDGNFKTFEGTVEGRLGRKPLGESGFGYDPIFYPKGHDRTFAQMSPEEKDSMSHRGRALKKLREHLSPETS
jgi:XTP/dITP diphosphohydrolase